MNNNFLLLFIFIIFFFMILIILKIYMNVMIHPVFLIILMLIYNILLSVNMSIWKINYLYSIMLVLIMISGLLVIFLYFSSLISNEKMLENFLLMMKNYIMLIFFFIIMIYLLMNYDLLNKIYWMSLFSDINLMFKLNKDLFSNIKMFYEYPFSNMTILCMLYLLMCLMVIIKMCSIKYSSLRKLN